MINQGTLLADQPLPMVIDPADVRSLVNEGIMTSSGAGQFTINTASLVRNTPTGTINGNGTVDLTTNALQNEGRIAHGENGSPAKLTLDATSPTPPPRNSRSPSPVPPRVAATATLMSSGRWHSTAC